MRTIAIIGGSKGIGFSIIESLVNSTKIINISRTPPNIDHENLSHHSCDAISEDLPEIDNLDGLVYCPGTINLKPFNRLSVDDFRQDFEINVIGAVKAIQKYLPVLSNSNFGSIVLFSTVATSLGMPFHASVSTAKSAIEGLTKSIAADLAPKVRVNAIAPVAGITPLLKSFMGGDTPKKKQAFLSTIPIGRFSTPQDMGNAACFLCSDEASMITGTVLEVDGGRCI